MFKSEKNLFNNDENAKKIDENSVKSQKLIINKHQKLSKMEKK